MNDPIQALRDGTRQILHEQHDTMREVVTGLSAEALNWKPLEDANSICVLLSHALDAEHFLVSSAVNVPVERDRESHFRATTTGADEMLALIDRTEELVDGFLAQLTAEHLSMDIPRPGRTHRGVWWLLHAVEHTREHVGQALLTRQLCEASVTSTQSGVWEPI